MRENTPSDEASMARDRTEDSTDRTEDSTDRMEDSTDRMEDSTGQPDDSTDRAENPTGRPDESAPDSAIVLEGVTKRYGETTALQAVDLAIHPGTFHGLIGPNGSGKTTLFALIAGLSNPTAGRVERPSGGVGYSFQEPRFFPELTVRENLRVFRSLDDDPEPDEWTETLLTELRLEPAAHRRAGELSGGFKKKLDLALSLLSRPQFLLLDEPLADVDEYSRRRIVDFFDRYCTDDRAILVSSHNAAAFEGRYDRITILVDGEVRADGDPDDPSVTPYRDRYG